MMSEDSRSKLIKFYLPFSMVCCVLCVVCVVCVNLQQRAGDTVHLVHGARNAAAALWRVL